MMNINILEYSLPLYEDPKMWNFFDGGRAGGKSHEVGQHLIVDAMQNTTGNLCGREYQVSLKDSVHSLISQIIREYDLNWNLNGNPKTPFWDIGREYIRNARGSFFIFKGFQDMNSIKSINGINRVWAEEAQSLSQHVIDILLPTIRAEDARFFFTWNNSRPDDPIEKLRDSIPNDISYKRHVTYKDNKYALKNNQLMAQINRMREQDYEKYQHVYLGGYNFNADSQIFKNKYIVADFEKKPHWTGAYYGLDWGFANDPTAMVECYIGDDCLYISRELCSTGIELDGMYSWINEKMPEAKNHVIRADNARPESISYCRRHGFPSMIAANKWPNSVKDGIAALRGFYKIIIHPSCVNAAEQFSKYSYKTDKLSGDVMPEIAKGHDHIPDALRYAIDPIIQNNNIINLEVLS